MATKVKNPLSAAHTAGIFADMSVDGPIIGTLVAIVDRAKNLPNRKTIGKQDPYCAARLGKEAKKTTTDIRGGQTPKWDQELRFTVHDCPDYYQLKISVFTDDKRTDLVGESWIDLRGIIVAGGGQSDMWQTLSCKGKYAGEIRVEITFYDTRPKPDKPAAKPKQPAPAEQEQGSVKQRTPVKRRPLPSDPVTGEAPVATPPAAPTSAPPALPPAAPAGPDHRTPPRHAKQTSHSGAFIQAQSPLQAVEYNTPPSQSTRSRHTDNYSPSAHAPVQQEYVTPTRAEVPRQSRRSMYEESPRHYDDRDYSPRYMLQQDQMDHRGHYSPHQDPYDQPPPSMAPMDDARQFSPMENQRPPPPPAHRSRHNSTGQELVPRGTYDTSPIKMGQMRHDVLRHEAQRQSQSQPQPQPQVQSQSLVPYPGRPTFRAHDSAPAANPVPSPNGMGYDNAPRHNSYDARYDPHYRSMQPTVEDAPENSGPPVNNFRQSGSRMYPDELAFDENPSPAPLVLRRSTGGSPYQDDYSSSQPARGYQNQDDGYHNPEDWQVALTSSHRRSFSRSPGDNSYHSHSSQSHHSGHGSELETKHIQSSSNYALPNMPAALVPGLDASQSQELTDLIYEDRRHDRRPHSQSLSTPTRGRQRNESLSGYNQAPPAQSYDQGYDQGYDQSYDQSYAIQPYRRAITYTSAADQQIIKPRAISPNTRTSPNPQHKIKRKSVSPAPPPNENRKSTEIPFGPDSYDALNPSLVSSKDGASPSPPDYLGGAPTKIITYDGREIDPSDHLPEDTWAPEPEKKNQEPAPEPRSRPPLSGAQPMPPTTRRARRTGRHSMSTVNSSSYTFSEEPRTPPAPSTGRARLQKRNRASAGNSPAASSPLAPISKDNYQERTPYGNSSLRGLPRASTWDFEDENRGVYGGPPIPAKIPLPLMMSGANGPGNELALMEEMQRIDIGAGRSRRRGGY
ncbi:hypothetical protein CDV31_009094 [Fusarium ambrosium]|uniref:C2 domain-containing protein n=1 Tax=Fusarium ambrosium TaxID=131363 RepID=A0A428TWT7_9HYPO|nr:hypothetical protein CDV31_009094 [Fusarium ambrosium]